MNSGLQSKQELVKKIMGDLILRSLKEVKGQVLRLSSQRVGEPQLVIWLLAKGMEEQPLTRGNKVEAMVNM